MSSSDRLLVRGVRSARLALVLSVFPLGMACSAYASRDEAAVQTVRSDAGPRGTPDVVSLDPPLPADAAGDAALPQTARFAFYLYGQPLDTRPCTTIPWVFDTASAATDAGAPKVDGGTPAPTLVNRGDLPIAYVARRGWAMSVKYTPGVAGDEGDDTELAGVLAPGESVDISRVYAGGIVALLGSVRPFRVGAAEEPRAGEGSIPWPKGVLGGLPTTTLFVATVTVYQVCAAPPTFF